MFAKSLPYLVLAMFAASAVNLTGSTAPAQDEVKQYTIEQFLATTSFSGASFSPDNSKILLSSDASGVFNGYAIEVDSGKLHPLTDSTAESIFTVGYFPHDERFLYTADQGGNELNHIYVRELDGTVTDLTPGEDLKAEFAGWADDDRSFYFASNQRDPRYFDLYQVQLDDYATQMIFQNDQGFTLGDISPDGKILALNKMNTRDDSDVYLYDRVSGETTNITPHDGEVNYSVQTFSPDGAALYLTTDKDSEFQYLIRVNLQGGDQQIVEKPNWDISFAAFSKQGKYFVIGINEDARTRVQMYDGHTMTPLPLPEIPNADIASVIFSPDESRLALYASSGRMPRDLFYMGVDDGPPKQLTHSLNQEINPNDLVDGEVVRFKSFDGTEVPGVLYTPHQVREGARGPALVWVHGGPGGQSRIGYSALIQYLVNHGYTIFAINNRGSSGYGKSFQQMDDRQHGQGDLDDCVSSKQMLVETGQVDPQRIGIIGGSYGGYMVLAALTFRPEEFQCGIDLFGISNWYRTVQNIPPWWEAQRAALEKEMGDFDDVEYFKSISPLFHADQIRHPLMVLQGANDPRVLKVESDEIVEAVRQNGVPVEYVVFPDEGHGFRKKSNQHTGYSAIKKFADRYLKGD